MMVVDKVVIKFMGDGSIHRIWDKEEDVKGLQDLHKIPGGSCNQLGRT
jgi:hypothetical protein